MQLKTLSLNKALFSNLSRSIIALTIINIICTFILVPFSYVITHIDSVNSDHQHSKYLIGEMMTNPIYFVGSMSYALLCAVFMTYFFKSQAASDFIHSLPIKRESILVTIYAVFFSHLMFNLFVNGLISWIFGFKYLSIELEKVVIWILLNCLIDFFIFTITLLFGLYINNMLNHIISSVILIASPFIVMTLIYTTHMFMFKGLQQYPDKIMTNLTVPIRFINDIVSDQFSMQYLIILLIVTVIISILLFVIYQHRKNERINEAYSTNYAHFITFFISMFIATMLGGIIFNSIFFDQKILTIFIYLVSFIVVYIFLEMVAQKSVRIQYDKKLFLLTLGLVIIAFAGVFISGQMREQYVPKVEDITSVKTSIDENNMLAENSILSQSAIKDKKIIQTVIDAHKDLIKANKASFNNDTSTMTINIDYKLNDGRKINRFYQIEEKIYDRYMKKVATQDNVARISNDIPWKKLFNKNIYLNIETSDSSYAGTSLNNKQKQVLLKLLKHKYNHFKVLQGVPSNNSALHFTFNENNEDGYEEAIYISVYDKDIINFLVKENIIESPSSALPLGKVYDLGNISNYSKIGSSDVKDLPFAKKIDRSKFNKEFNENGADAKGNRLYFFDGSYQYVVMKK